MTVPARLPRRRDRGLVQEARGRAIAKLLGALPIDGSPQHAVPLERRRLVPDRTPHYLGELIDAAVRENA